MTPCFVKFGARAFFQSTQWKSGGREINKPGLHMQGRDSVFTSPVSAAKPSTPVSAPQHNAPKEVSLDGQRFVNELQQQVTPCSEIVMMLDSRGPAQKVLLNM